MTTTIDQRIQAAIAHARERCELPLSTPINPQPRTVGEYIEFLLTVELVRDAVSTSKEEQSATIRRCGFDAAWDELVAEHAPDTLYEEEGPNG